MLHRYSVGGEPRLVVPGTGALYVSDFAGGRVVRVDPSSGKVTHSAAVCAGVQDLQVHAGAVWAACMKGERLVGLDPVTLRVVGRVPLPGDPDGLTESGGALLVRTVHLDGEPEGVAAYQGHLWVVLQKDAALVEVDPSNGKVLHRYAIGGAPRLVVPGANALYVSDFAGGRVVRVDPGTGKVTRSAAVCAGVQDLQVHAGAVWGACMKDERLVGLDPATLRVVGRVPLKGDPDGLTESGGALLVSLQDGPGLATVDTSSGTVRRLFTGKSGRLDDEANNDVLVVGSTAYLSDYTGNAVTLVPLTP